MEDLVDSLTRGNPTEVKVVLATVVVGLAAYQLVLAAVVYRRVTPRFLEGGVAGLVHRASGRAIAAITVVVALMCIAVFGYDLEYTAHVLAATALLAVLVLKIVVVRRGGSLGRYLPLFGLTVFTLFVVTWVTSAGDFLADQ